MKELLDYSGHPLFIPVFLYCFIGGLFLKQTNKETFGVAVLLILLLFHIVPLILFHVSIKYMTQVSALTLILISFGASKLNINRYVLFAAVGFTFAVFLMYFINNIFIQSLCN